MPAPLAPAPRQKRIALVNDLTGFGRCSIAVELPIVSALGVQGCPLPTAVLSCHSGFPEYEAVDFTPHMRRFAENWLANGVSFDGILTGWIGSEEQVGIVLDLVRAFKRPETIVVLDPVMGDYGRLYDSYTPARCERMRDLLAVSDVATPNLTEACRLLGAPYPDGGRASDEDLARMAAALSARGPGRVVITGLPAGRMLRNYVHEEGEPDRVVEVGKVGDDRSGNGDAFAAIVAASLVRGEPLVPSVEKAAEFIRKVLVRTERLNLPWNWGLAIEECLTDLR